MKKRNYSEAVKAVLRKAGMTIDDLPDINTFLEEKMGINNPSFICSCCKRHFEDYRVFTHYLESYSPMTLLIINSKDLSSLTIGPQISYSKKETTLKCFHNHNPLIDLGNAMHCYNWRDTRSRRAYNLLKEIFQLYDTEACVIFKNITTGSEFDPSNTIHTPYRDSYALFIGQQNANLIDLKKAEMDTIPLKKANWLYRGLKPKSLVDFKCKIHGECQFQRRIYIPVSTELQELMDIDIITNDDMTQPLTSYQFR